MHSSFHTLTKANTSAPNLLSLFAHHTNSAFNTQLTRPNYNSSRRRAMSSSQSSSSSSSSSTPSNWIASLKDLTEPTKLLSYVKSLDEHEAQLLTSYVLLGSIPLGLFLSPSVLNIPLDLAINIALPVHMVIGLDDIIEDYCPRAAQQYLIYVVYALAALTAYGFLKINLCGPGIVESLKSLWRQPPKNRKQLK